MYFEWNFYLRFLKVPGRELWRCGLCEALNSVWEHRWYLVLHLSIIIQLFF